MEIRGDSSASAKTHLTQSGCVVAWLLFFGAFDMQACTLVRVVWNANVPFPMTGVRLSDGEISVSRPVWDHCCQRRQQPLAGQQMQRVLCRCYWSSRCSLTAIRRTPDFLPNACIFDWLEHHSKAANSSIFRLIRCVTSEDTS